MPGAGGVGGEAALLASVEGAPAQTSLMEEGGVLASGEGAPAQTSQAAPSHSASQARLAALEQQLPEGREARLLHDVQPAGGAGEAAGRADLLAEELTCILEFLNAQVGRAHVRLYMGACGCVCAH